MDKVGIPTPFSDKVGGGKMQTSSPPVITPNRSQSNPDDVITLPRPIQSVGMNLHNVSGTSTGQTLPRERRAPPGTHFCPTIGWVYPPSATIFILHPLCPLFHPLLSEIYSLVTTLIHPYFSTATTILPPIRRLSAASTMFPRNLCRPLTTRNLRIRHAQTWGGLLLPFVRLYVWPTTVISLYGGKECHFSMTASCA